MRTLTVVIAGVALSGCAMSSGGLAKSKLDAEYTSAKAPAVIGTCLAESFHGSVQLVQPSPDHAIVTRSNGYGIPMARWDIRATDGGSRIEFRHSVGIMVGKDKAEQCF